MPRRTKVPRRKAPKIKRVLAINPSKGLNNLVSSTLIDNREMSDLLNVEFDEGGVIRKRSGYSAVGAALTAAKGLGVMTTESVNYPVTIDGTALKYYNGTSWNSATGATFTAGQETSFTQVRDKLYVWNGLDGGTEWDGTPTGVSRPGTMPRAKFGIFFQDRHIVSGVTGQPNRLFISDIDDGSAFTVASAPPTLDDSTEVPGATVFSGTAANFIDVRKNDGDFITGLARYQDVLIIFKRHSIYQLTFDSSGDPVITPITAATGCVSHRSIDNVENDVYFLSPQGLRVLGNEPQYFTAIRTNVISIRVQPTIDAINTEYETKCNALYFDNKYIMGYPTTTSSISNCLVYDKRFQGFTVWDSITPNAMVDWYDDTNEPHLYFLNDAGTQMYEVIKGQYNDAGVAIDAYITSKAQDFGNIDLTKRFVDLGLAFRRLTGLVTVTVYLDDEVSIGSVVLGTGSQAGIGLNMLGTQEYGLAGDDGSESSVQTDSVLRVVVNQNSRTLKFKIRNNRLNENFVFLGNIYGFYVQSHYLFDSANKIYI